MEPDKTKEIIWGIVILIVVIVAVFVFTYLFGRETPEAPVNGVTITEETPEENVADFPEGFPLEEDVSFDQSFKFIPVGTNDEQSTLSYTSNLSLQENVEIFEKYIADNGFEIINQVNEENMAFYYAEKEGNSFSLILEDKGGEILISASYLVIK